jgi:hypothetical protein
MDELETKDGAADDALDTIFRACHGLDRELPTRAASGAEVCLLLCRERLARAGWKWDAGRQDTVFRPNLDLDRT